MNINGSNPIKILLVEDNPGDADLVRDTFEDSHLSIDLDIIETGEMAKEYLFKQREDVHVSKPDVILLDLNLPKMSGHELLEEISPYPDLSCIPVFILTTSNTDMAVVKSYILRANGFINKPICIEKFCSVLKAIDGAWFNVAR